MKLEISNTIINKIVKKDYISFSYYSAYRKTLQLHSQLSDHLLGMDDASVKIEPFDFQLQAAYKVLFEMGGRALLADEVGLGKTIEAGIILKEYLIRKQVTRVLILVPSSLLYQWQQELRLKFKEEFHIAINDYDWQRHNLVLGSLERAKRENHAESVYSVDWDLVIVDEAHKLRNHLTKSYHFVDQISKKRMLFLTATPIQNNVWDLYNLLVLLNPASLPPKSKFEEKYVKDEKGTKIEFDNEIKEDIAKQMIRRTRSEVGLKHIEREVMTRYLNFSSNEKQFEHTILTFLRNKYRSMPQETETNVELEVIERENELENLEGDILKSDISKLKNKGILKIQLMMYARLLASSPYAMTKALHKIRQRCNSKDILFTQDDKVIVDKLIELGANITQESKIDEVINILKKVNSKLLIFTTFVSTMNNLALVLESEGFKVTRFSGILSPEQRDIAIREFEQKSHVMICTDAGSEGTNLQFCNHVINYDIPWNPMKIEQRIGRIDRIGQKNNVYVYNLVGKESIECYILLKLYEKINLFKTVVGETEEIIGELLDEKSFGSRFTEILLGNESQEDVEHEIHKLHEQLKKNAKEMKEAKKFSTQMQEMMNLDN